MLDNASPHKTEPIGRWLQRHPRFTFHFSVVDEPRRAMVLRTHHQTVDAGAPTARYGNSPTPSTNGPNTGTKTPNRSSGTKPPTKSSTTSPTIYNESPTQDTRSLLIIGFGELAVLVWWGGLGLVGWVFWVGLVAVAGFFGGGRVLGF